MNVNLNKHSNRKSKHIIFTDKKVLNVFELNILILKYKYKELEVCSIGI